MKHPIGTIKPNITELFENHKEFTIFRLFTFKRFLILRSDCILKIGVLNSFNTFLDIRKVRSTQSPSGRNFTCSSMLQGRHSCPQLLLSLKKWVDIHLYVFQNFVLSNDQNKHKNVNFQLAFCRIVFKYKEPLILNREVEETSLLRYVFPFF